MALILGGIGVYEMIFAYSDVIEILSRGFILQAIIDDDADEQARPYRQVDIDYEQWFNALDSDTPTLLKIAK